MSTMVAKYRTKCPECDDIIDKGDVIVVDDGGARHGVCPEDRAYSRPQRPPCPRCFMEPAANGACGCDE